MQLPHALDAKDFEEKGSRVRYRLTFELETLPPQALGIFVRKMSLSGNVYLNGTLLGSCERGALKNLRCLHRPYLFTPPMALWITGTNTLEFEIYASARQLNGLSAIEVGDAIELSNGSYLWRNWWQIDLVRGLSWLAAVLGCLCLAIGMILRRDSAFLWFGLTTIFYAISNINVIVSQPPISMEWFAWVAFSSRLVALALLYTATLSLFQQSPLWCKHVSLGFAVVAPLLVWVTGSDRGFMMLLFVLLMVLSPVLQFAILRWIRPPRHPLHILVFLVNFAFFGSGIADWLRLGGMSKFEGVYLTTYTYGIALILFCATMLGWLAVSLSKSRLLSLDLIKNTQLQSEQIKQKNLKISEVSEALLDMQSMALQLTENIPVGVFVVSQDAQGRSRFSFFSSRWLAMLDLERNAVMANPYLAYARLHPEEKSSFRQTSEQAIADHSYFFWEGRVVVNNAVRWVRAEATPRMNQEGHCSWDGILTDITELKASQIDQQKTHALLVASEVNRSRLEERERMLQDLHDGFGSNLITARLQAEQGSMTQGQFQNILSECLSDLYLMIDTMSDSYCTLQTAVAEFRYRTQNRMEDIGMPIGWHLELDTAPELPYVTVLQILRIILEALNNTIKHSKASIVHVHISYQPALAALLVRVIDNGIGFNVSTNRGKGLGIMQNRARKVNANLHIASDQNGTQVIVTLLVK